MAKELIMVRYKNDPSLKYKTVKTITGETEYRRNCRKIKDKYYVQGEQCFLVGDTWYAYTSKLITFDYEKGVYVLIKDTPLVYGVAEFKEDGSPIMGYFTENRYNNILVNIQGIGSVRCLNQQVLEKGGYIENISDGVWHRRKGLSPAEVSNFSKITSRKVYREKGYNIEDNAEEFRNKILAYKESPIKIPARAVRLAKMLGNTTVGMEVETALGYVPDHIQNRHGIVICRDGSIDNAEYVTVPMHGAKCLCNIKYFAEELSKRTIPDIKCSFHIHLGTVPDDRLFIVALWALAIKIQDELYTMFPGFKTYWEKFKKKDYNQKVRKLGIATLKTTFTNQEYHAYIDDAYYRIHKFLNDGHEPDDRFNRNNHQHVRSQKWERAGRYYWINFMNMFFSERKTIEFRLHQATTNGQKMVNWLFICNAILKYAEKNARKILSSADKISLNEVLDYYKDNFKTKEADFLSRYLKAYVEDRKQYFANDNARGDYESRKELVGDKTYSFGFEDVTWLF
jgi:hypothetical protein